MTASALAAPVVAQRRRGAAVVLVTVLLSALVACGSSGESQEAAKTHESPSATVSSPSASSAASGFDAPFTNETLVPAMTAAMRGYDTAHVAMDITVQGMAIRAEGDASYAEADPAMSIVMDVPWQKRPLEMRLVDGAFYVSMPPATPPGKFLEMDASDPNDPLVGQMGDLTQMVDQMDPVESAEALQVGLRMVEYVGPASSPDGPLAHYRLTVDVKTLVKQQGLKPKDLRGAPKTVDYEVWLDEENRMRRLRMDLLGSVFDMTISDWGKPVNIVAPAPNDIVEAPAPNA